MGQTRLLGAFFLAIALPLLTSCTSSDTGVIDSLLGHISSTPILTSIPAQTISQGEMLKVDVNNIKEGVPGNDNKMAYDCAYDTNVDGQVDAGASPCSGLSGVVHFNPGAGTLEWTPDTSVLGNFEFRITGTNDEGKYDAIFNVGVRLRFDGLTSTTHINGLGATLDWTPNPAAIAYQLFKLNTNTGEYELFKTVTGGSTTTYVITTLQPNTGYTFRVKAQDALGFLDANAVSRSFTTTELVKFAMSPATANVSAGTPITITVQAYNVDDSPQTIGGLPITPQIQSSSGTSLGTFSAVTDNNDGTYSFNFMPTTVGTPIKLEMTTNTTFFLRNTSDLTFSPGPASSTTSTISTSASTLSSAAQVTLTGSVRDAYNNPITNGSTIGFSLSGGTSTGLLGAVSNQGNGVYSATYTGVVAGTAQTARITVDAVVLTPNPSTTIQVLPGTPVSVNSTVTVSAPTVASGSTVTVTAILKDINNNPVPSGIAVAFNKAGGTSSGNFGPVVNAGNGVYTTTYSGVIAGTAQTISVSVDSVTLIPSAPIQVLHGPAAVATSTLEVSSPSVVSASFVTVTATLKDINNNPVDTGTISFTATGGTSTGTLGSVVNQGGGVYTIKYTGVNAGTAQTLRVLIGGVNVGLSETISVTNGAPIASHSAFTVSAATVVSGNSITLSTTLKDVNDNPVSSGITVGFVALGGTSTGNISAVTNAGNGVYTATYTGLNAGSAQNISVQVGGFDLGLLRAVTVLPGAMATANSSLTISAGTVSSGSSVTLTATLRDVNGNPIDAASVIAFTKTGGTSTGSFGSIVAQGGGVYTVTYTGIVAGTAQTIGVNINGTSTGYSASIQVLPGSPALAPSTLAVSSPTVVSGSSVTFTATIKDANSNPIPSGITVDFTKAGGTSTGDFGTVVNAGAGVYTITYTGLASGSAQSVAVTIGGTAFGLQKTITVLPAPMATVNSSLTISAGTVSSGSSVTLTATLRDLNGNPIDPASTVAFTKSGGTSTGTFGTMVSQGAGVYTITYTGVVAGTAQTIGVTINGVSTGYSANITVVPGSPSVAQSSMSVSSATVTSGSSVSVSATIKDANNNVIPSGISVDFTKAGGSSVGNFSALTNAGAGVYTITYTGVTAGSAQTLGVTIGGSAFGLSSSIQVLPGTIYSSNSSLAVSSASVVSGAFVTFTATLRDVNNNPIDPGSTVVFSATGGTSTGTLGTVSNQGNGVYTVTYTGVAAGTAQTMRVSINGTDTGLSSVISVTPGAPVIGNSSFSVSSSTVVSNNSVVITGVLKDANNNPIPSGLTISFSATGGTSTGSMSALTNLGDGSYTATYTGLNAGTAQTLTLLVNGAALGLSASITVQSGALYAANSSFTVSASTVTSGASVTVTATLKDVNNNPIANSSTIAFTKTGGTSTGTFGSVVNQGGGVYTVTYSGVVAGTAQTLGVTINTVDSGFSASVAVTPGAPVTANSSLSISSATLISNTSVTITALMKDSNNNPIPSGIVVGFQVNGGSSTGTLSSVTNAGGGNYTATYTGLNAGTAQTVSLLIGGSAFGLSTSVTVLPGSMSVANSSFTVSASTVTSGASVTLTATLRDVNNNAIATASNVAFTKTGGTSTGTFGSVVNQGNGVYTVTYSGLVAGTAQTLGVTINTVDTGFSGSISVLPGAPSPTQSSISVSAATLSSGSDVTVTGTIRDANNNPLSSGITVAFSKTGGSSTGNFGSVVNAGSGVYTVTYTGVTAGTAQTLGILVDNNPLGPTTSVQVNPGAPSSMMSTFTVSSNQIYAGQTATLTATIRDANGNPISAGLVMGFSILGGTSNGSLSAVTNQGSGVYTATYQGTVAGTAHSAQATVNAANFGPTQSLRVLVGAPNAAHSSLTITSSPLASGGTANIAALVRDAYDNPITTEYTISIDVVGGSSTGTLGSTTNAGSGNYTTTYQGMVAGSAQTVRVLADGTAISGLTGSLQVVPGAVNVANSTFLTANGVVQSGTAVALTMSLRDVNNNAISTGQTITFNKSAGVSNGTIAGVTNNGNGNYSTTYTGTTQGAAQTVTLVVNGTTISALNVSLTVTAGPPAQIAFGGASTAVNSIDCNGPYTITLKDASGNTTTSLTDLSVSLNSNPTDAYLTQLFTTSACNVDGSTMEFPAGQSTISFYYKSYTPQAFDLTVTPSGVAANTITITNASVLSWIGAGEMFKFNGTGTASVVDDRGGGFWTPQGTVIRNGFMYVVDSGANRIMKYNLSTSAFSGWIGHIGSLESISSTCASNVIGDLTPGWCTGGRSSPAVTTLLNAPRGIGADDSYIYVASNHRVLRFDSASGAYAGWIGKVSTTAPPVAGQLSTCTGQTTSTKTPGWCVGGTWTSGANDGEFNTPTDIRVIGSYLYVADYSNHRIQRFNVTTGAFAGWMGRMGAVAGSSPVACANTTIGDPTPTWCFGGTPTSANRYQLAGSPSEVAAPPEGFNGPISLDGDSNYLYVADYSNRRIVRINQSTGLFEWIGRIYRSTSLSPMLPAQTAGNYTYTWSTGGSTNDGTGNPMGFCAILGLKLEGSYLYTTDSCNRLTRVQVSDGQDQRWIGRVTASPSGGVTGCSSTPIGGVTPGWCYLGAGNRAGQTNSAFYNMVGIDTDATFIYAVDQANFRIQKFNKSTGAFAGWIGAATVASTKWSRGIPSAFSRMGIDDNSFGDMSSGWTQIAFDATNLFVTDPGWHRIKRYNKLDGSFVGYIGQIGTWAPIGNDNCVGFTSGMTPDWCYGGGRTGSGAGIHGYNNPYGVASDGTYIYIVNVSNQRVDRVRINDALYMGWIGRINGIPTDGDSACLSASTGTASPGWCIGGSAQAGTSWGMFNTPRSVTYDSIGDRLYVMDTSRLMRINPSTGAFDGVIGGLSAGSGGCSVASATPSQWCTTSATASASNNYGALNTPTAAAINTNYIYVMDTTQNRITRYSKSTGVPMGFIGRLNNATNLNVSNTTINGQPNGCNGYASGFPRPTAGGWCYATAVGGAISVPAVGSEEGSYNSARGMWADDTYIYVADTLNNRIVRIEAETGKFKGWKGFVATNTGMTDTACINAVGGATPTWCYGGTSGPSTILGTFDFPTAISGDANYLYVHDGRNNRVVTIPR